ncbi:MAG TPA: acyl-CoA dehydrogenase family protein [Acidimicrobiales bacterium]|jgi:alkylation response protein AidB-like acyl-CoA dehydrogenase|nr:acyl-CoA dehydrogenase family protein [Acidimicrobiales bacterium]
MDFRISADQRQLADGIRAMVQGRLPLDRLRAHEGAATVIGADEWAALGETGVFSLTLPEPDGIGLGMADAVVVFEELGRALVPGPLVGTFLAASAGLVEGAADGLVQVGVLSAGSDPILVEHLPDLAGLLVVSGFARGATARFLSTVPSAESATRILAPLDPLTPLWHLASLPAGEPVRDVGFRFVRDGSLLTAALQVGHAAETLDLAVAYAKERHQFGKPIGSFQAVKHICADMLVRSEVARSAVQAAACLADDPDVVASEAQLSGHTAEQVISRAVMGAKVLADEAALANARAAIQVHGGMGYTWEVPLHLHLKRSRLLATTFGTPAQLSAALSTLL